MSPDPRSTAVTSRPGRHRKGVWLAAAALSASLAFTGSALADTASVPHHSASHVAPAPTHGAGLLRWTFGVEAPAGYQLLSRAVTTTSQAALLRKVNDPAATGWNDSLPRTVLVVVYARGAFPDAAAARHGTPVRVGSHRGYFTTLSSGRFDAVTRFAAKPLPSVAWEYRPGAWATVQATTRQTQQLSRLLRVAAGIRPGRSSRIAVPLRLRYLPAGFRATGATQNLRESYGTTIHFGTGRPSDARATDLRIQVWSSPAPHATGSTPPANITVGARPALLFADDTVEVPLGRRSVTFELSGPRASRARLMQILGGVRWAADVADPAAWFDARTIAG